MSNIEKAKQRKESPAFPTDDGNPNPKTSKDIKNYGRMQAHYDAQSRERGGKSGNRAAKGIDKGV